MADAGQGGGTDLGASKGTKRARSPSTNQKITRKRTKTGCLTCRKRRIKCGEEKPVCANCIKSRRHCDGYNPRFTRWIRDPNYQGPMHMDYPADAQNPLLPGSSPNQNPFAPRGAHESGFSPIQPRPVMEGGAYGDAAAVTMDGYPSFGTQPQYNNLPGTHTYHLIAGGLDGPNSQDAGDFFPSDLRFSDILPPGLQRKGTATRINTDLPTDPIFDQPGLDQIDSASTRPTEGHSASTNQSTGTQAQFLGGPFALPGADAFRDPVSEHLNPSASAYREPPSISTYPHQPRSEAFLGQPGITQILEHAAVDIEDNDYYDVFTEEDDEVTMSESLIAKDAPQRSMGVLLQLYQAHSGDVGVRGLDAFMFPGFIDIYRPERVASPLKNEYTAKVFAHFICFTGPMISGAVRLPSISSAVFNKVPMPSSRQSLWTYTLPMMALHNQGLLQAMLAMASLQIAKLQDAAVTPSLKHYSYSLRRVHHAVRHDRKRHEVTTLAATLLLAFYEVMTADHISWSTHLFGASRLIKEINFGRLKKRLNNMKAAKVAQEQTSILGFGSFFEDPSRGHNYDESFVDHFQDLDEDLIATLMGKRFEKPDPEAEPANANATEPEDEGPFSNAELQNIQILQDLYWWYCKHDLIHSIVSGNSLMMPFETWSDCPPRSAVGQPNTAHGTLDHTLLLVARVCHFTVKDRARKIKASFSRGNPFRTRGEMPVDSPFPAEGLGTPTGNQPSGMQANPTSIHPSHDSQREIPSVAPQGPPFYGMAPSSQGTGNMPSAFGSDQQSAHPSTADLEDIDLESATAAAMEEWNDIHAAFTSLSEALGPWYQPLGDNEHQPEYTPFGQTIFYKSYDIASVWAWYYTGLIVLTRAHPSMPPAATVALGIAARQTALYANTIGRIVAGMTPSCLTSGALHPAIAGAFTETTLPLFFAGVQYTDLAQRRWTIQRLREIENLTGWASVGLCANGCESVWIKAAEMGRGPPYEKEYFDIKNASPADVEEEQRAKPEAEAETGAENSEDRRFVPFVKGSQVMWSYNLFDTPDVLDRHGKSRADG